MCIHDPDLRTHTAQIRPAQRHAPTFLSLSSNSFLLLFPFHARPPPPSPAAVPVVAIQVHRRRLLALPRPVFFISTPQPRRHSSLARVSPTANPSRHGLGRRRGTGASAPPDARQTRRPRRIYVDLDLLEHQLVLSCSVSHVRSRRLVSSVLRCCCQLGLVVASRRRCGGRSGRTPTSSTSTTARLQLPCGHRRGTGKGLDAECGGAGEVGGRQVTILQDSIIDEYMTGAFQHAGSRILSIPNHPLSLCVWFTLGKEWWRH